jgi:hypothetical protein
MELRLTVRRSLALALTFACLAAQGEVRADERSEAEARFYEGTGLYQKGKYDEARLKFAQAYAVLKKPAVVYNLAKTEALTLRAVDAATHFREYLKTAGPSKEREDALRELSDQYKLVTQVEVHAPEGAGLFVDGEQVGLSPLPDTLLVAPGPHTVTARVGEAKQDKAFTGSRGETLKLSFVFEKPTPAPAPPPTPTASSAPQPFGSTFTPPPDPHAERPGPGRWLVPSLVGLVGAAGVGVGVGFGLASRSAADEGDAIRRANPQGCRDTTSPVCAAASSSDDERRRDAIVSVVGYGAGGVVLAVSGFLFYRAATATKEARATVVPLVGPRSAGLTTAFSF